MKRTFTCLALLIITLIISAWSCQRDEVAGPPLQTDTRENSPESNTPPLVTESEREKLDPLKEVRLVTPADDTIRAQLAYTASDQGQGLSGVLPENFDDDQGKLFFYLSDATRTFWMPNTYFDLDIIYLDKNLEVVEIIWRLPHHPGKSGNIPRAPSVRSRHVLEMKAGSAISGSLRVGDRLRWRSQLTLPQTESKIRQRL